VNNYSITLFLHIVGALGLFVALGMEWTGLSQIQSAMTTVGSLVLMIALAQMVSAPRMAAIWQALVTEKGPFSKTFHSLANHPLMWISIQTRVAIALGIVFLKVSKPDLGGSLLTIGVVIILGVTSALPVPRRERAGEGPAD
jgi:hypothetical protein